MLLEFLLAGIACVVLAFVVRQPLANSLALPFFNTLVPLGWFYIPFGMLVIAGASNAVNLTDGLDGLAIVPSMIAAGCFGLIAYLVGKVEQGIQHAVMSCRGSPVGKGAAG